MSTFSKALDFLPYVGVLRSKLRKMRATEGRYPAGHYYSPIPSGQDVLDHIRRQNSNPEAPRCPGVDLHKRLQFALLEKYATYYNDLPWGDKPRAGLRFHFGQEWFCYADAIFLYCHLRERVPQRVIEVGSGFSSAVMLDTAERFLDHRPEMICIEPNPERLSMLLHENDMKHLTVIPKPVQEVPLEAFSRLETGDLLFVDSSHVLKAGSDLHFIFFHVLPSLKQGVVVHFHDVFFPFEYAPEWLRMGRFWNEAYSLRAFLSYNSKWSIRFFNSYVGIIFRDYLFRKMPLCLQNTGGSIYIERCAD